MAETETDRQRDRQWQKQRQTDRETDRQVEGARKAGKRRSKQTAECRTRCVNCCNKPSFNHALPARVDRLLGLVVRRPPRERKVSGSNPDCDGIFSGSSHTSDLKIGTPVAALPGAWRYRVSTGTGRPGVSIL